VRRRRAWNCSVDSDSVALLAPIDGLPLRPGGRVRDVPRNTKKSTRKRTGCGAFPARFFTGFPPSLARQSMAKTFSLMIHGWIEKGGENICRF